MTTLVKNVLVWQWEDDFRPGPAGYGETFSGWAKPGWIVIDVFGLIDSVGFVGSPPTTCTNVIDGEGQTVVPGLIDSHIHVAGYGESLYFLQLGHCKSIDMLQEALKTHNEMHADLPWIQGTHWEQEELGKYPTRQDLDKVCPDKPVLLWRACWHICVANTKALQLAGILSTPIIGQPRLLSDFATGKVEGGEIDLDNEGLPTGVVRERAVEPLVAAMGQRTLEQKKRFLQDGMQRCVQLGLTSVQTNDEGCLEAYQQLQKEGNLSLRVFLTPTVSDMEKSDLQPSRPQCLRADMEDFQGVSPKSAFNQGENVRKLAADRVKAMSLSQTRSEADVDMAFTQGDNKEGDRSREGERKRVEQQQQEALQQLRQEDRTAARELHEKQLFQEAEVRKGELRVNAQLRTAVAAAAGNSSSNKYTNNTAPSKYANMSDISPAQTAQSADAAVSAAITAVSVRAEGQRGFLQEHHKSQKALREKAMARVKFLGDTSQELSGLAARSWDEHEYEQGHGHLGTPSWDEQEQDRKVVGHLPDTTAAIVVPPLPPAEGVESSYFNPYPEFLRSPISSLSKAEQAARLRKKAQARVDFLGSVPQEHSDLSSRSWDASEQEQGGELLIGVSVSVSGGGVTSTPDSPLSALSLEIPRSGQSGQVGQFGLLGQLGHTVDLVAAGAAGAAAVKVKKLGGVPLWAQEARLTVERIKIFGDGSLGAETAAIRTLTSPAVIVKEKEKGSLVHTTEKKGKEMEGEDEDGQYSGVLIHETSDLVAQMKKVKSRGFRLEVHAIGDKAAEQVLDAFRTAGVEPKDRPVLTHCQVLGADLIVKMARLGVVANVQPSFVPTDMRWVNARLAQPHLLYAYAWNTLLRAKADLLSGGRVVVAGGSDAPIESPSPLEGIYDAVFRRSRTVNDNEVDGSRSEVFRPEECLSFSEALYTYTVGGAYAGGSEHVLGRIKPKYAADLVFLRKGILDDLDSLKEELNVQMVMVGGQVQYRAGNYTDAAGGAAGREGMGESPYFPGKNGPGGAVVAMAVLKKHAQKKETKRRKEQRSRNPWASSGPGCGCCEPFAARGVA